MDQNTSNLAVRTYLDKTVIPLLMEGLIELSKQKPENPLEFLAHYLLENNPEKTEAPGNV